MSLMDFFRSSESNQSSSNQASANQGASAPANAGTSTGAGAMGDTSSQNAQIAVDANKPVDPLAAYGKLFEESTTPADVPPSFKLDSELIGKTAAGMNFLQGVPDEVAQAAQSGDAKAIMQMVNYAAQKAYQSALSHSSHLTDKFVDSRSKFDMEKGLAPRVKTELTQQALASAPNYSNPVVKEKLNEEARRFQKAYPDATPQEIAKMAQQYIMDLATALNPNTQQSSKSEDPEEVDWAKYLTQ